MPPLPTPNSGEGRDDFLNRCMANATMVDEYPDEDQRYAICNNQWDNKEFRSMKEKHFTSFDVEIKESDDKKREITVIGSKQINDRDNDIVSIDGMDIKNYKRNPTFIWAHRSSETPENVLGTATKVWKDGKKLMFKLKFLEPEINPRADMVYKMYKAKALRAFSIGFAPDWNEAKFNDKRGGFDYGKSELLEISAVPVPANPAALIQNMVKSGVMDEVEAKDFEIFIKENQPEIEKKSILEKRIKILETKLDSLEKRFETPETPNINDVEEDVEGELNKVDQALEEFFTSSDDKSVEENADSNNTKDDLNSFIDEVLN